MSLASEEETNFARVSQIIIELFPQTLRDVLYSLVDPATLSPPVKLKGNASSKLSADQRTILHDLPNDGNYNRCDISMLYILYRGLQGVKIKPTKGWGKLPIDQSHTSLGDDVERIRVLRNQMFGHVQTAVLSNQDFLDFTGEARDILGRFDNQHGGSYASQPGTGSYVAKLNVIENKIMDSKAHNNFRNELQTLKARETALDVRIKDLETDRIRLEGNYDTLNKNYMSTAKTVLDIQQNVADDQESISTIRSNMADIEEKHDKLSKGYESTEKTICHFERKQLEDQKSISTICLNMANIEEKHDKLSKNYESAAKSISHFERKHLYDEQCISTLQINQTECNHLVSVIQSEQVKDRTSIEHMQRNLETINEVLDNKEAPHPKSEQIGEATKQQSSLFSDDGTNHYHCIAGTSFYVWAHHSSNQDPSKLLNTFQRNKYIPEKVSYQLYENGDTRLYSPEELESKFLEKFRNIFSADMERQPWLLTNLHEDCVENRAFYEFCKKVEGWGLDHNCSFLFVDYRFEENLSQMNVDIELLKRDLDIGDEDSKYRILLYLAEKKMMFNIQFVKYDSGCAEEMKRNTVVEAILKGHNDLKLFSALYLDLLDNSDVCFTSLVAVSNFSKEDLHQLKICNGCSENLLISSDDLKNEETLAKKLNTVIFQRNKHLECTHHLASTNELYEKLASKIWASLSVRDVHLPNLSANDKNTLTRIYLNNAQRRFLQLRYNKLILKGGYGSGKSILAQEKFKERINHSGPKDQLYYIVFSDDTLYTSALRSSIQSWLPTHVSEDQICILNIGNYKTKHVTYGTVPLSTVLDDIYARHWSVEVTVIIDELDGSFLMKEEAIMIGKAVKNFRYALFVIQSMEVSRTKVEKAGLFNTKKTAFEGHQLDYTEMKVITLDMIMRNSTRINQLSRVAVKVLECHTNRYYERTAATDVSELRVTGTELLSSPEVYDNKKDEKNTNASRVNTFLSERSLGNPATEIPLLQVRKTTLNANFDHCAKRMSTYSQCYTGITYESKFQFHGDLTDGHSIEGCVPRLIYPFSHDAIDYTSVNNETNKLRMFFTLKHLVQVEYYIEELAIITFDAIDAQLIFEILNALKVPVVVHAPALLLTSNQTFDTLQSSLKTHILITDHIGARGMEFKKLLVVFNPNEVLLQQYLIEAFTRATFDLSFLLIYKEVQKLKEESTWWRNNVGKKLIKEWVRQKLVVEYKVTVCGIHKEEDLTSGVRCLNCETYEIHPWHKDFDKSTDICQIKEPHIDAGIAMKQFETLTRRLSFQTDLQGHSLVDLRQFVGRSYMLRPFSAGQAFLHQRKSEIWADKFDGTPQFLKVSSFVIVGGLAGKGVSFRSLSNPKRYIRHQDWKLYAHVNDNSALFKQDATFEVLYGLAASNSGFGVSFESVNYPGYFISLNRGGGMIIKESNSAAFKISSTFMLVRSPKSLSGNDKYFTLIKIITAGGVVGKTRARMNYTGKRSYDLAPTPAPTVGTGFSIAQMIVDGYALKLQICDTSSQTRFKDILNGYTRGAHAITLWFDVSNMASYQSITKYQLQFMQYDNLKTPIILVGNKIDLWREVTSEQGWKLAKQINAVTYIECSAWTGEGVAKMFEEAARVGLEYCLKTSDND